MVARRPGANKQNKGVTMKFTGKPPSLIIRKDLGMAILSSL